MCLRYRADDAADIVECALRWFTVECMRVHFVPSGNVHYLRSVIVLMMMMKMMLMNADADSTVPQSQSIRVIRCGVRAGK